MLTHRDSTATRKSCSYTIRVTRAGTPATLGRTRRAAGTICQTDPLRATKLWWLPRDAEAIQLWTNSHDVLSALRKAF